MSRLRKPVRAIREPFGKAGLIVACLALVFAMIGGAYAATGNGGGKATASAKAKQGKQGKQGKTGKTGPAGPAGPAGLAGVAGANGKDGTNGTNGAPGIQGPPGLQGAPGPLLETLESGQTVTGMWGYLNIAQETEAVTLSYPFRLAAPIASANIVLLKSGEGETTECPGTLEEPEAAEGFLCLYQKGLSGPEVTVIEGFFSYPISLTTGASLLLNGPQGAGSWAVTAP